MNFKVFLCLFAFLTATLVHAQELDGSDVSKELRDREARLNKLSVEDQLKIRAAQQKAAEDPDVKAALEKRNQVIREYRATVRAAMLKADPSLGPLLEKIAIPSAQ